MRKTAALLVVILIGITLLSCRERSATSSSAKGGATDTIAPAAAQPSPNGNDAMTQTVDIQEDGRSESDGGVITNPPSTAKGAVAPRSAKAAAGAPPVKKKKS